MKTDLQLATQATALKAEAAILLHEQGLLALLQRCGPVRAHGSFLLDLMTWRDLDLAMQLPHAHDVVTFFATGQQVAQQFTILKMSFSNQHLRPDVPFDHGLYWGIRLLHQRQEWKIDLWGYGPAEYQVHLTEFEALQRSLAAVDRRLILRIKDDACRLPSYRHTLTSVQIYEAVAQAGVQTVDDFYQWHAHQQQQTEHTP